MDDDAQLWVCVVCSGSLCLPHTSGSCLFFPVCCWSLALWAGYFVFIVLFFPLERLRGLLSGFEEGYEQVEAVHYC